MVGEQGVVAFRHRHHAARWIALESRVRHRPSGPWARLAITTWVWRFGSFSRESQWSNAAAMTPATSIWAVPLVPMRVRATSRSIRAKTSEMACRWQS